MSLTNLFLFSNNILTHRLVLDAARRLMLNYPAGQREKAGSCRYVKHLGAWERLNRRRQGRHGPEWGVMRCVVCMRYAASSNIYRSRWHWSRVELDSPSYNQHVLHQGSISAIEQ